MRRWPSLILVLAVAGCLAPSGPRPDETPRPAPTQAAADVEREAILFETEFGPIVVVLYPEAAPRTVALMKTYVEEGYYVGREFNRVVPGHVIQLVDKAGGTTDDARRVPLEPHAEHHFSAGAAGIARGSDPDSGGPEFFIMDFATSHLDGNYTVWGQVVQGQEVVHRAARVDAVESPLPPQVPVDFADRTAIDAVAVTGTRLIRVRLGGPEWDELPMRVARNVRMEEFRHSMDWPRSIAAGRTFDLTWYVRPYNDTQPPPPEVVRIHVAGEAFAATGQPQASGVYHWKWSPPAPGAYNATISFRGSGVATLRIDVPG